MKHCDLCHKSVNNSEFKSHEKQCAYCEKCRAFGECNKHPMDFECGYCDDGGEQQAIDHFEKHLFPAKDTAFESDI